MHTDDSIIIRNAFPDDAAELARLGSLDATHLPHDRYLVAEVDGELQAARGMRSGAVAADPFAPTAGLVELLELHAKRLRRADRTERRLERLRDRMLPRALPAR